MSPADRLNAIVEQGLCIGCGLCQVMAGAETLGVVKTTEGSLRPVVHGDLSHETVDTIYDVCPGTRVDGLHPNLVDDQTVIDPVWGPWQAIVTAWAADPEVRFEGSTGGVLTALGQYLLRSHRVGFILHTRASADEPTFGRATISFTEAEVFDAAGSRYGPTATLIDLDRALDLASERGEPFAFIGKPCDIAALNNYGRHDSRVDEFVRYRLAPVCGGFGPPSMNQRFLAEIDVEPSELTGFRYRGRGCPGPTRAETAGRAVERHYLDYWGEDESHWSLLWRCKICPDGIGESADLVAADTWVGGSPQRSESDDDPGTNAVVARTAAGAELLASAIEGGALVAGDRIGISDLSRYQPHQVNKKQAVADRYGGLADEGRIVPVHNRLRLTELAEGVDHEVRAAQRAGTRVRIADGRASEPRPRPAVELP